MDFQEDKLSKIFMNLVLYGTTKDVWPVIYYGKCLFIWLCLNQMIKECIPSLFLGCYLMLCTLKT